MRRRSGGFTLLEVTVALAIVAIGLIAAFNGIIQMAHSTALLRDRALADWIATNTISDLRISGEFPDVGNFDGSTEYAGRAWRWEARVSETGVTDLRRIDMYVAFEELPEETITIVSGFIARRSGAAATRIDWWGAGVPSGGPGETEPPPQEGEEPPPADEESEEE
jgi:general secretion pathway protein I